MTCDDFERTFEVKRGFALLRFEVKGVEFDFAESAEEFDGGSLDSVFFGDLNSFTLSSGVSFSATSMSASCTSASSVMVPM